MALRAGYYGLKKKFIDKVNKWDQIVFPRAEQAVLGAKNVLRFPYNGAVTGDNIFTVNSDGSVAISAGTHSTRSYIYLQKVPDKFTPPKGRLFFSAEGLVSGVKVNIDEYNGTTWVQSYNIDDPSNPVLLIDIDYSNYDRLTMYIDVTAGIVMQNDVIIKPMISFDGGEFVPYAMTNRELTVSAADQKTTINAIITAATSAADFAAFKTAMGAITPVTRSLSMAAPEEIVKDEIEEPVVEKKTTKKKSTAKTETTEEV